MRRSGANAIGVAALVVAAAALTGCSQVAALAPVGGDHLTMVRFAAIDVLVDEGIDVLTAPVCSAEPGGATRCEGETVDGEAIAVRSSADDPTSLTVEVDGRVLYSGSIQEIIDEAARDAGSGS